MDWEVVNGITGLVSAISAVLGIGYFSSHRKPDKASEASKLLSSEKLASFVMACSGWILCCLSFLWVVEPYGVYPTDDEYRQFFGVILGFPAIVLFFYGFDLLLGKTSERKSTGDKEGQKENSDHSL